MLREEQIDLRRQRAKAARFRIENLGKKRVFSDYRVTNPESGGAYTVSVRGFDLGDNACTCPDFKANTLGTCKHIEAVLDTLKDDLPAHLQKKKAAVTRPEITLHYGEQLQLQLHLPKRHSDKLKHLSQAFFDERPGHSRPVRRAHRRFLDQLLCFGDERRGLRVDEHVPQRLHQN